MAAIVRVELQDVVDRLSQLGFDREGLIEVVKAMVAAHSGCTANDPPNAPGFESYRIGVRVSREIFMPKGWDKDNAGNFCTILNPHTRTRLAVMNSDDGAGLADRVPQNKSRKGAYSERAAAINQLCLADDWPIPDDVRDTRDYKTFHLCVFISERAVRAELSLLNEFEGGYFTDVFEKIILVGDGDWDKIDFGGRDSDAGDDFDVEVRRRS